jgi:DNA-binding MarR family transcriptional regulator
MKQRQEPNPIAHDIRTLDNLVMRNFFIRMRATGLDEMTVMHGWILAFLYRYRDQDIFQRDVEAAFSIGRSTVTNIIQRMEGKGLIVRRSVGRDARLKKLELTPLGEQVHLCMDPIAREVDQQLVRSIPQKELDAFRGTLSKLRANVQASIEQQERSV